MTLPNFLIIGAAKAGTTSLYHYLAQHPDVFMSPIKETNYFCDEENLVNGTPAIRDRGAYQALFAAAAGRRAVGEASPKYLNGVTTPDRIHAELPGVRLIISLRNPADRAWSSYLGRVRDGIETHTADAALRPGSYAFDTSFYYPRLERYFRRFARERIEVILFDDLVAHPAATLRQICRFLEIDPDVRIDVTERHNPAVTPRFPALNRTFALGLRFIRPMMPRRLLWRGYGARLRAPLLRRADRLQPKLRRRMLEQYRDDIRATGELIGRDLSHWLT